MRLARGVLSSCVLLAAFGTAGGASAEMFDTTNDFGNVGLMQTPSARFADEGEFGVGYSIVKPYNQGHILAEPLSWLEASFRYTDVTNVAYGPQSFSGNQSYKDRSFGFKFRLIEEGENLPAVALGIQDFGGTGIFSGEYLVANRRYYNLDFSLGLGWGRPGAGGRIHNPLGAVIHHFDNDRTTTDTTTPGGAGFSRLFTGKTVGLFGGAQWKTPIHGVTLRVEYDGNDYKHEGLANEQTQASHVNFGVDYEPLSGLHFGVAYERGDLATLSIELRTNFAKTNGLPKLTDPPPPPIHVRDASVTQAAVSSSPATVEDSRADEQTVVDRLKMELAPQDFNLLAVNFVPERREIEIWISQDRYRTPGRVIGRAARVLTEVAPDSVERFTVINMDSGVETYRATVLRRDFESAADGRLSSEEILVDSEIVSPQPGLPKAEFANLGRMPRFSFDMGPGVRQQIGGPDGFYFGELLWRLNSSVQFTPHLSFSAAAGVDIIDNFSGLTQPSNSQLPHVRSDIVEYLRQGRNSLSELEGDYIWSPAPSLYSRISAGIFEDMYGGVAGQMLYRPFGKRYAVGVDVNYLKQRGFTERFDFRNYSVVTGFLDLYYNLPICDLVAKVSVGSYLARDHGATFDIARRFSNGVLIGGFATFTNVSSAKFGEGSFDKGIYLSVPFDLFFTRSSRFEGSFVFRPLTRDGGQRAVDGVDLYSTTQQNSLGLIQQGWPDVER